MIKSIIILITNVMFLSMCFMYAIEIRSLWVTPWSLTSPEKIDEVVSDAIANNQNEILAEIRYRADALYVPNKFNYDFPNPEPRSNILPDNDFDPLEYLLDKAHENGIYVQAWLSTLCATQTSRDLLQKNYIYVNHPEWILVDAYGRRMNGSNYMGNFVDPGILASRSHLINVMLDIVANYPALDGIHLDYIRYPAIQFGHSLESVSRYKESNLDSLLTWNEWRIKQITDLIREFREKALAMNPKLLITAAVFADTYDAKEHLAQDWTTWLQEGLIDRAYPMAYAKKMTNFKRVIDNIESLTDKSKVVIGLRAWQENYPRFDYKVEQIIEKALLCRQMQFGGIALFSYDGIKKSGFFPELTESVFLPLDSLPIFNSDDEFIERITSNSNETYIPATAQPSSGANNHFAAKLLPDYSETKLSDNPETYIDSIELNDNKLLVTFFFKEQAVREINIIDEYNYQFCKTTKIFPSGFYTEQWGLGEFNNKTLKQGVYTIRLVNASGELVDEKKFLVY